MPIVLDEDREFVYQISLPPKRLQPSETGNRQIDELFEGMHIGNFSLLAFLGDMHVGHKDFSIGHFQKAVIMLKKAAEKYTLGVVLMGDLIETEKNFASNFAMIEDVAERLERQFQMLFQLLDPIKRNIVAAVWGNHEERLVREEKTLRLFKIAGIDNFLEYMLKRLNPKIIVPPPQRGLLLNVKVGRQNYDVRINHGRYAGFRNPSLQNERESENYPTVSLIVTGHHHRMPIDIKIFFQNKQVHRQICMQWWLGSGTFLRYPGYAEAKGYPVNVIGLPVVKLYSNVNFLHPDYSPEFMPRFHKSSGLLPLPSPPDLSEIFQPLKSKTTSPCIPPEIQTYKLKRLGPIIPPEVKTC